MDYLLHHLLTAATERYPEKIAVCDERVEFSYTAFAARVGFLARVLTGAGVKRGDRVAFFLDHGCDQAIAIFAISQAGGVFVPINHQLFPDQVKHSITDSEAVLLVTTHQRLRFISEILPACPSLRRTVYVEDERGEAPFTRGSDGTVETDLAAILYTSGSTGKPKGVMLSHRNLIAGCWIVSEYLELSSADRLLGILPLSFDYGLNQLITMVGNGGTYRFFSFQLANEIVNALERYEITGLAGVPGMWALLARSTLGYTALPHLRRLTNSGGAMPTAVLFELRKRLPDVKIYLMYGLTEAFRSTYLPPHELEKRPTSIGKAIPNTEIFVLSESGTPCRPGEQGILVHRGPTVSLGYWKRPEDTAERFRELPVDCTGHVPKEKVVYSGDLVTTDEEGYLYFIGRKDAMIKTSGHRISPWEIEEVVFKTGIVKEAAAIGCKHDTLGQRIKVLVVPASPAPPDLQQRILAFCAGRMPAYMVPGAVEIVDELPKTPTGKIDYPALSRREAERADSLEV